MRSFLLSFRYFDLFIFGSSILLLLLGLLMIYSTSLEDGPNLLARQLIFAAIGLIALFALSFFDYRNLKKTTWWLYLFMIGSLLFVWIWGLNIRGSTRWIDLGIFRIQPAEFAKIFTVIILAKYLDSIGEKIKDFRYVLLSAIYVGIPFVLILIEPDLGSAMVIFFIWLSMLMFSRMNKKHFWIILIAILILSLLAWTFVLEDYQKNRIYTFINPNYDPQGTGYNVLQSIIAVGSGGLFGRGLGRGLQSQLKFLPERQTDFIFASTAEELGLLGSLFVVGAYALIFFRLIRTTKSARDNFGMYLSVGIFFMLLIQVVINIGMNIGLLPVTGIPLPLLSLGGSSLITTFIALGLTESIIARQKALKFS